MSDRPQNPNQPDQNPTVRRDICRMEQELRDKVCREFYNSLHSIPREDLQNHIDSGFDDPEYPFLKQEQDALDEDGPGVNPWPLVLVIVAVGTVLTLLYVMVQALLR